MSLSGPEFLRRFLQHVLPKGLHRVRTYGLLHPSRRPTLRRLQWLLGPVYDATSAEHETPRPLRCPHCRSGAVLLVRRLTAEECFATLGTLDDSNASARAPPPLAQLGASSPWA